MRTLLILLLLVSQCLSEEILQFHLQLTENEDDPQPILVSLAGDILEFETVGRRVRYNFKKRRSMVATPESVEEFSLYSDIGFRVAELQNRVRLGKALDKAGIEAENFESSIVQLENLFGIAAPNAPEPVIKDGDDVVELSAQDRLLFRYKKEGEKLTPEQSKQFVRFVRYFTGGHPDVLAMIESEQIVPVEFSVVQQPIDTERVRNFQFVEVRKIEKLEPFPEPTPPPSSQLEQLLAKAKALSIKEIADHHNSVEQRALELLDTNQFFPATLSFLEATLNTGRPLAKEFNDAQAQIMKDGRVPVLLKAMRPRKKAQVDASIKILESLKEEAGDSGHVLAIFQGSLYLGAKRNQEARNFLLPALDRYPSMSSVWKDLGETYYQDFQTAQAWKCWDTGRSLSPENSHYRNIEKLEKLLETTYPGFF